MLGPCKGRVGAFTVLLLFVLCAVVMLLNNFEIGSYFQRASQPRGEVRRERVCEYHAAVEERLHEADGVAALVTNVNTLLGKTAHSCHPVCCSIAVRFCCRRKRGTPGQSHRDESAKRQKQKCPITPAQTDLLHTRTFGPTLSSSHAHAPSHVCAWHVLKARPRYSPSDERTPTRTHAAGYWTSLFHLRQASYPQRLCMLQPFACALTAVAALPAFLCSVQTTRASC
jgi:hypothetical protein